METKTWTELDLANRLSELLRVHGDVSLQYITANFEPFSSQTRPDVVFTSSSGDIYCVELRFNRSRPVSGALFASLPEHASFVKSQAEGGNVHFAFATDADIPFDAIPPSDIRIFSGIVGPTDLADRILRWTALPRTI